MVLLVSILGGIGMVVAIAALMGISICVIVKQARQAAEDDEKGGKRSGYYGYGRYCYHPLFI
jgi:hypothetical protein